MNKYLCFVQTPLMSPQTSRRNLCNDILCNYQIKKYATSATDSTNFCDTDMLSIIALWKAETEVFNCSFTIFAWCRAVIHHVRYRGAVLHLMTNICNQIQKPWHVHFTDKYLWSDAKVLYLLTKICDQMQRLCTLWQIFVRCRAGGKYLTVDTSHSPQWQSATTQGCPWPWRRGNAFWTR